MVNRHIVTYAGEHNEFLTYIYTIMRHCCGLVRKLV